jgi:hypothetical protein
MEATSTFSFVLIDDIILLDKRDLMVFWSLRGKYLFNLCLFSSSTREILLCTQKRGWPWELDVIFYMLSTALDLNVEPQSKI